MKTEIIEFKKTELYCPVDNEQIYVAIKPICEAIGIDSDAQNRRIKRDEILSQLRSLVTATGRDNKTYEMVCLPLQYIFGWLFTIESSQVKKSAKQSILDYKKECYDVLYNHFWNHTKAIKRKEAMLTGSELKIEKLESSRKELGKQIKAEKQRFKEIALAPISQLNLFETPEPLPLSE